VEDVFVAPYKWGQCVYRCATVFVNLIWTFLGKFCGMLMSVRQQCLQRPEHKGGRLDWV
jgi:hypothetical protein